MEDEVQGEEDTLTPPATTSPSSVVGGVSSATSSVLWSKSSTNHRNGSLLRQVSLSMHVYVHDMFAMYL